MYVDTQRRTSDQDFGGIGIGAPGGRTCPEVLRGRAEAAYRRGQPLNAAPSMLHCAPQTLHPQRRTPSARKNKSVQINQKGRPPHVSVHYI